MRRYNIKDVGNYHSGINADDHTDRDGREEEDGKDDRRWFYSRL
jgi:hypothetical protein